MHDIAESRPVRFQELIAAVAIVVLADLTVYRGHGFAGYSALFLGTSLLLLFGTWNPRRNLYVALMGLSLWLLAAKLIWYGSYLLVGCGFALVVMYAMVLAGICPYVLESVVFAAQTVLSGYAGLCEYWRAATRESPRITNSSWLNYGLPLIAALAFGLLFVMANPNLETLFGNFLQDLLQAAHDWLLGFSPRLSEVLFWGVVLWVAVGLLRPIVPKVLSDEATDSSVPEATSATVEAALYAAFRNTLLTVIVLFALYLSFEFKTLWFRVFPEGFYYSGYAHEGAAWLTVALALSTVILSIVFRGAILNDPRLLRLRGLAWIWSVENLILAIAVYHRLLIYVGFNGMTRMRIVGFFGISTVVVGFLLVLWKIGRNRNFVWLVRHHLWALAFAVYLFALTPVDWFVVQYNVRRILSGDSAPSVQISVHPISPEGLPYLQPLLTCNDSIVREGVRALLAEHLELAEAQANERSRLGWTTYQISEQRLLEVLSARREGLEIYDGVEQRSSVLQQFHDYAYQWY